ncbi:unnamed protein product, partial [marine sediment metagenome]
MAENDLILRLRMQSADAQAQLRQINAQLRRLGGTAATTGRKGRGLGMMFTGLTSLIAPAAALYAGQRLLRASTEAAADFGWQLQLVGSISGSTDAQIAKMGETAKTSAIEMGRAPTKILEAYQALASAGLKTDQVLSAGADTIKLATVRGGELATVARLMAASIKLFGEDANNSEAIASKFAHTVSTSLFASVEELSQSFKFAGAAGTAYGQNLEGVLATLGGLMTATQEASMAGTAFRGIMAILSKDTKKLRDMLEGVSLTFEEINVNTNAVDDV